MNRFCEELDEADCRRVDMDKEISAIDAKCSNLSDLVEEHREIFYNWGQGELFLSRGRALIFHDELHTPFAMQFGECFEDLGYSVKTSNLSLLPAQIGTYLIGVIQSKKTFDMRYQTLREPHSHHRN
jgi:hypothetical protein